MPFDAYIVKVTTDARAQNGKGTTTQGLQIRFILNLK